jgi:hypothetical protein
VPHYQNHSDILGGRNIVKTGLAKTLSSLSDGEIMLPRDSLFYFILQRKHIVVINIYRVTFYVF